jgi:CubicO group peptidase (beta-lactamase class C family)
VYYPPPESEGGWRFLRTDDERREIGGMDPYKLQLAAESIAMQMSTTSSFVIIRHGWIVAEYYELSALTTTRYDIWSSVKSFTGTAYAVLFGERPDIGLDTRAYEHIPAGHPLTDPRKAQITLGHLLTMTSGIPGESVGIGAVPTATGVGPFEAALGYAPCTTRRWPNERWANKLHSEPGTRWDYSDPAFAHLGMAFTQIAGRQMRDFMQDKVFEPIGIEAATWDLQGVGTRFGPHTNAHTGIHISARELARFGYLMLRQGLWQGHQIVPREWVARITSPSQTLNPAYGYTWWTNGRGARWPGLPHDLFACQGLHCNGCWVIPSLDLVVARTGYGPVSWPPGGVITSVVDAITDRDR